MTAVSLTHKAVSENRLLELTNGITIDVIGNPNGAPIVFLCGWGMSTEAYHSRLEELGAHFHIYAISLPGFGRNSPLPLRETNVPAYATLMAETIDHLGLPTPFIIMGHSTGGGVATLVAKQHPDWISHLVLITPIGSAERMPGATKQFLMDWYGREDLSLLDMENLKKNALHATVLAWNATRINLISDVNQVVRQQTPVHMFLSKTDYVAPPGALGDVQGATIHWVHGGHTWFRHNENEFTSLMTQTLLPQRESQAKSLWHWFRGLLARFVTGKAGR